MNKEKTIFYKILEFIATLPFIICFYIVGIFVSGDDGGMGGL